MIRIKNIELPKGSSEALSQCSELSKAEIKEIESNLAKRDKFPVELKPTPPIRKKKKRKKLKELVKYLQHKNKFKLLVEVVGIISIITALFYWLRFKHLI